MAYRRGRFDEEVVVTQDFKEEEKTIALEARDAFLKHYLSLDKEFKYDLHQRTGTTTTAKTKSNRNDRLADDIKKSQDLLKTKDPVFTAPILLPKVGLDKDGISTRLAKQFAQLFGPDLPYVQLSEKGIQFYWNNPADAEQFRKMLRAHGFHVSQSLDSLTETDEPKSELRKQYQKCQTISIPHSEAEKLLFLAQYHPYYLKATLDDWYRSKNLNRPLLLVKEAGLRQQDVLSIEHHEIKRVGLDDKNDLIMVPLIADVEESKHPHHAIILFDDSGSMDGNKIKAANNALKKFVDNLPSNTIVSIQPMNAKTVAYRTSVEELKKHPELFNIPATGMTPLSEILAASAAFLRSDPEGFIISEEEFNHSTIAVLTDGQGENSAEATINMMQTSQGFIGFDALNIPGMEGRTLRSYGIPTVPCNLLPPTLPISIGEEADSVFIDELAAHLHTPMAHVQTNKNMDRDINHALDLFGIMRSRVPTCYVGLTYQADGKEQGIGVEEHNIFNKSGRYVYFEVPKEAKHIRMGLIEGQKSNVESLRLVRVIDRDIADNYLREKFLSLQVDFSRKLSALSQNSTVTYTRGGRGDDEDETPTDTKAITEKWTKLQSETLIALEKLESQVKNPTLLNNIGLFKSQLKETSLNGENRVVMSTLPSRAAIATYTQQRVLGDDHLRHRDPSHKKRAPHVPHPLIDALLADDQKEEPATVIEQHKAWINEKQKDKYAATPLIRLVVHLDTLKKAKEGDTKIEAVRQTILALIARPETDLLAQDANGMNALHRSAWGEESGLTAALLLKAKEKGQANELLFALNNNEVGATHGETPYDHVQTKFSPEERDKILKIAQVPLEEKEFPEKIDASNIEAVLALLKKQPELLNQHLQPTEYKGATPLIALVKLMHTLPTELQAKVQENIIEFIESGNVDLLERDQGGNILLHQAIYHGEHLIAQHIAKKAHEQGKIKDLLAARNNIGKTKAGHGGEVPHLNLAAQGYDLFKTFDEQFLEVELLILKYLIPETPFFEWIHININKLTPLRMLSQLSECLSGPDKELYRDEEDGDHNIDTDAKKIQSALTTCAKLSQWLEVQKELLPHLEKNQIVEYNHLITVYSKHIEHYNAANFLKASPLQAFRDLKKECTALLKIDNELAEVGVLLESLQQIEKCKTLDEFNKIYDALFQQKSKDGSNKIMAVEALFNRAHNILTQYQAYLAGRLAPISQFTNALLVRERKGDHQEKMDMTADIINYAVHIQDPNTALRLNAGLLEEKNFIALRTPSHYSFFTALDTKGSEKQVTQCFSDIQKVIALVAIRDTLARAERDGGDPITAVFLLKTQNAFINHALTKKEKHLIRGSKIKTLFTNKNNLDKDKQTLEAEISSIQKRYQPGG